MDDNIGGATEELSVSWRRHKRATSTTNVSDADREQECGRRWPTRAIDNRPQKCNAAKCPASISREFYPAH